MNQTQLDPCLFVGDKVVCICYVDYLILWSQNESDIDDIEKLLIDGGVDL